MKGGRRRGLTVLAVLAFTASGACGTTSNPSGDGRTGAGSSPPVAAGADVKRGGVWRESLTEPATLDPSFIYDGAGVKVGKLLFVGLTTFDDNPDLVMRPGVAERWSANADCTQWTFNLRRSTFTNGEPVTADSFIRTMTRAADGRSASRVAGHLSEIQGYAALHGTATSPPTATTFAGLSAPDPQTLVIALNAPNCEFDRKTYHWVYSPVPEAAGGYDNQAFSDAPIGNGPFMLEPGTGWEHDKGISLVRNDSYFGPKPHLDAINFTIFGSQAPPGTTWQAFQAGELDVGHPPAGQRRQAEATYGPHGGFVSRLSYSTGYVQPNNTRGPMANVDARKAVSMALDRDAISHALQEGYSQSATAFVAPRWGPYHQPGVCDACRLDPAAAREAAARGGLTPGTRLRFVATPGIVPTVQAMKDQLEKTLGVEVAVEALPVAEVRARRELGDFDLGIGSYVPDYPTVDALLYAVLGKDSAENTTGGYNSAEFESLIGQARAQRNEAERRRLYQAAERQAVARDQAVIPGNVVPSILVFDGQKWGGVDWDLFGHGLTYSAIHLK